jgi:hypothetical protein
VSDYDRLMTDAYAYVVDGEPMAVALLAEVLTGRRIVVRPGGRDMLEAEALLPSAAAGVVVLALRLPHSCSSTRSSASPASARTCPSWS